jgi:putative ABC transport system permease protein
MISVQPLVARFVPRPLARTMRSVSNPGMTTFLSDITHALRMFAKKPVFALTAILTLALGIGAAAAIFSVVNAVLLRPLPYDRPERLVHVANDMRARNVEDFPWPPADFHDLRSTQTVFSGVAALVTGRQVFVTPGQSDVEQVSTGAATPNLFRVLGAGMQLGSDFTDADGIPQPPPPQVPQGQPQPAAAPPPPPKTILSHQYWQRRFGGDPAVVGTVVRLGGQPFDVIGVLDPEFELLYPPGINVERVPDVWTPLALDFASGSRINVFLRVIGRLKEGVTIEQAQREVDALAADLRSRFPIKNTAGVAFRIEPMHEDLVREVRPVILALMGAVTFVLLIACANVANLLLVRAAARERELAVRAALGGTRWRIVRQLLTESVILAALAIALGLLFAWGGVRVLLALGPENLPRLDGVAVDPMVVTFAALAGLVSIVAFGLIPAIRASRPDVMDLLRRAGRTGSLASGNWLRSAVVTAEVALSFVLLVGCGLMIRSFVALQRAEPGYDVNNVLTFSTPNLRLPDPAARQAFMRNMRERLKAMPGVIDATAASPLPLDGRDANARWGTEEALSDPAKFQQATVHIVLPGYFAAMRTRVIEGREFIEADNRPDARVIIIDRVLAGKAFPGQSAVGKTLVARISTPEPQRYEVIGVVDHQRHVSPARDGREAMFVPDGIQHGAANRWGVRTTGDPMQIASAARALVTELNPRTGAIEVQPMTVFMEQAQAQTKFALVLIGIFAGVALLLAAVGLYSVLSTTVRQRTAEIGVRMAFGAGHGSIFNMMVVQGLRLSAAGVGLGIVAALLMTGAMRSMLVGVRPSDPATFIVMAVGFLIIAAVACGLPALRASRLDPMVALRDD